VTDDHPDRPPDWLLPWSDFEIMVVTFAFLVDIDAYRDGGASVHIRLDTAFSLTDAQGATWRLVPSEGWEPLAPLLGLRGAHIETAHAWDSGHMRVVFTEGWLIESGPDPHYSMG
jgi:hypothetical protein